MSSFYDHFSNPRKYSTLHVSSGNKGVRLYKDYYTGARL